jgi:hypothetical protein
LKPSGKCWVQAAKTEFAGDEISVVGRAFDGQWTMDSWIPGKRQGARALGRKKRAEKADGGWEEKGTGRWKKEGEKRQPMAVTF